MTTVFHARLYGRFVDIQSYLRRNELHRMNQGFLGGSFSNGDNTRTQSNIEEKGKPRILKDDFPQEQTHRFSYQKH